MCHLFESNMFMYVFLFGFLGHSYICTSLESVDKVLYDALFTNYSKELRPVVGSINDRVYITVQFVINQIEELNEKDQFLTSHGNIAMAWTDQLLTWDPAEYNGAASLVVPASKIWLPELTPGNSVIDADELAYDEQNLRVRVFNTGVVVWSPKIRWKTTCPINITTFPYDEQDCVILYVSEVYTDSMLAVNVVENVITTETVGSTGWELTNTTARLSSFTDDYYTYPIVELVIKLKRNSLYFELNIVLPAILLSLLLIPMFMLPVDSGEKVSLGVTLMLAYSIFLLMLTDYTPQSGTIPNLSVVLLVCIVFSGVGMFVNVVIINIHHHLPEKPVPSWVKRIFLGAIGNSVCRMDYGGGDEIKVAPNMIEIDLTEGIKKLPLVKNASPSDMEQLLAYLEFFKSKRLDDDQTEQVKEDWNKVARVLDRIFLIVYILLFVVFLFVTLSYKWKAN